MDNKARRIRHGHSGSAGGLGGCGDRAAPPMDEHCAALRRDVPAQRAADLGQLDEQDVVRFHEVFRDLFGDIVPGDPGDHEGASAASADESGIPWWKGLRWWQVAGEVLFRVFGPVLYVIFWPTAVVLFLIFGTFVAASFEDRNYPEGAKIVKGRTAVLHRPVPVYLGTMRRPDPLQFESLMMPQLPRFGFEPPTAINSRDRTNPEEKGDPKTRRASPPRLAAVEAAQGGEAP